MLCQTSRRLSLAVLVLITLALSACGAAPRAATTDELNQTLDGLNQAIASSDPAAISAALQHLPNDVSARLATNFAKLAEVEFVSVDSMTYVRWQTSVGGELWHEIKAAASCRAADCALTQLAAKPDAPAPPWLIADVEVKEVGQLSLISSSGASDQIEQLVAEWRAAALPKALAELPAELRSGWDGTVKLLVPSDRGSFAAVIGAPSDQFAGYAALTISLPAPNSDPPANASMIVINPDSFQRLSAADQQFVLTHELSHVATAGIGEPAAQRRWVSEGIAEQLAIRVHPSYFDRSCQLAVQAAPLPAQPPSDAELLAVEGLAEAELAYVRSWLAVSQLPADQWLELWQANGRWTHEQPTVDFTATCG